MLSSAPLIAALLGMATLGSAKALDTRASSETPPVTVKGNAFYRGNERFYIRGIDYQPGGSSGLKDPIADEDGCKRDVVKFKDLGLNTIRVYTVDNSADHDACMKMLSDAGIYLALDVNSPKYSINRADPKVSYNSMYLQSVFATIDAFEKYDNTLLFFSANEVVNDKDTTPAALYVKATARDMKKYMKERNYRKIPVGYSAADIDSNRHDQATFMDCGSEEERSDFFAFNDYSWCSPSSYKVSGWDKKVEQYKDYNVPLFLSEFGCNTNKRDFGELEALYGKDMTGVYSGGLVYEYSEEGSNYGIVKIDGDSVTELDDYSALKSALAKYKPASGDGGARLEASGGSTCPNKADDWEIASSEKLPPMPSAASRFMSDGAGPGQGLEGGSQSGDGGNQSGGSGGGSSSGGGKGNDGNNDDKKGAAALVEAPVLAVLGALLVSAGLMV